MSTGLLSLCFSVSSSGSLSCSLRAASKLAQKAERAQTSMLLILGFAETSNDSEPIFAQEQRVPCSGERLRGARVRLRTQE
jgi:hypothetical protein